MRRPRRGGRIRIAAVLITVAALAGCMQASPPGSAVTPVAPVANVAPAPEVTSEALPPPAAKPAAIAASASESTATVGPGDTLYSIARAHDVPIRDLIQWNGLDAPYDLTQGQTLRLPPRREHVVAAGETVYSISRANGVDMTALTRMNGIEPPYTISVGQKLELPSSTIAATPQSVVAAPAAPVATPVSVAAPSATRAGPTVEAVPLAPLPAGPAAQNAAPAIAAPSAAAESGALPEPESKPVPVAARSVAEVEPAAAPPMAPEPKSSVETAALTPAVPVKENMFLWPLRGKILSGYGAKKGGEHNDGVNIEATRGEPVRAAADGTVIYAGNELRGFGNLILLKHAGGWTTAYAHNDRLLVARGATVKAGQIIAKAGSTGNVSTPQLHFEIRRGTRAVNPADYLIAATANTSVSRAAGPGAPPNLE